MRTIPQPESSSLSRFSLTPSACCAGAVVCIGEAIHIRHGVYDSLALRWLAAGIILSWLGVTVSRASGAGLALLIAVAGIAWDLVQDATDFPMPGVTDPHVSFYYQTIAIPAFIAAAAGAILLNRYSRTVFVPLLLLTYFASGVYLLRETKPPYIDVYEVSRDACEAMSRGVSPYAIDFPVYPERRFYPPGSVVNGRVKFGYPYTPLDLLFEYPAHLLTGDFRIGILLAMTAAAGFLAYGNSGPLPAAAAALLLLTPEGYYSIQQGWVDPIVICALAFAVFCARRRMNWIGAALGLLLASKQDMLLCLPAAVYMLPQFLQWKQIRAMILTAAITTAPLALWNWPAFWHSAVVRHLTSPFRDDSLNFAAAWAKSGHAPPPDFLAFLLAAVAMLAMLRLPRSANGFSFAVALVFLCFFAAAKQAFCNYYIFIIGALCCVIAS
ncbi:MAG TPA: hypothetical protein VL992_04690 [Tepidisphaeraceae bacterium]|nr:hypothetical protein [Tepidisphaeraceae bacterium]